MTLAQRQGGSHRRPSIEAASDRAPAPGHTSASRASSTSAAHHRDQQPNSPLHVRSNALLPPLRLADSPPPAPSKDPLLQLQHPPSRSLAPSATTTLAPSVAPQHQARTKSVSTASPPKLQRPPLGSRANSAPHVPKQSPYSPHGGAKNGHVARARHPDVSDSSSDDDDDDAISRDPFFLRYQSVIQRLADQSPGDPDDPLRKSPEQQKKNPSTAMDVQARTLPASARSAPAPADRRALQAVDDINIGVIGDSGVGKTRFIDRAFDLRSRSQVRTATRKMSIDGTVYTVRLVEVPFEELDIEHDDRICWPEKIDDMPAPRIDGALMLYDVMNQESLAQVPGMLNVVHKAALPCVLVGCKCDNHPAHRQVDPAVVEQRAKTLVGDLPAFQSSDGSPESQRICLSVMLRAILASRQDTPASKLAAAQRRRATSNSSALQPVSPRPSWKRRHERASSEFSGSRLKILSDNDAEARAKNRAPTNSFLDLEESPGYESYGSDGADSSDYEPSIISVMPSDENGYTFEQLVDRLVSQPLSKQDTKFVSIFLALYRKFAAPSQLLEALIKRFDALENDKSPQMVRTIAQLRHLSIMEQWLSSYPGDFAHPMTKRMVFLFVNRLASNRIFAVASKEILADLDAVLEDDDTDWACSDKHREHALSGHSILHEAFEEELPKSATELTISITRGSTNTTDTSMTGHPERSISTSTTATSSSQTMMNAIEQARQQAKLLVPIPRVTLTKTQWHLLMGESEDNIARELTRMDWIMFQSIRPRDLVRHVSMNAAEKKKCKSLENVDRMIEHFNHLAYWVTNFILLRDKPKHRALMLEKFMKVARKLRELNNYNSLGAILAGLNGTAIHRLSATRDLLSPATAKDFMKLEILMGTQKSHFAYRLAWENSSGERIPYLPLHRRDLVSAAEGNSTFVNDPHRRGSNAGLLGGGTSPRSGGPPANAEALSALTGNPGNAAALQAALNRASAQEKEAPPSGVEGKERINWKKFAIMGEVIVGMQRAQGFPYPNIARNDDVKSMILDVRICKDDDELYDRSTSLEAVGAAGEPRRRFANWFRQ
ncbi:Ras guanine nucleotide exchange factor A [Lasiodiplodia hormozganensis]|uniref:Ras guanine nucleotide exchange factor A n=1 Tax=Lasiodiplodia hormozganensis TaxID=869390 RepID=A0AA39Z2T4_9PEZI|nr:Ras guanine nucleotide exchange factor A [Lasiodiplodia hormozganensis]